MYIRFDIWLQTSVTVISTVIIVTVMIIITILTELSNASFTQQGQNYDLLGLTMYTKIDVCVHM